MTIKRSVPASPRGWLWAAVALGLLAAMIAAALQDPGDPAPPAVQPIQPAVPTATFPVILASPPPLPTADLSLLAEPPIVPALPAGSGYLVTRADSGRLQLVAAATGITSEFPNQVGSRSFPSPDGTFMVWLTGNPQKIGETQAIFVARRTGSELKKLGSLPPNLFSFPLETRLPLPVWSPDGTKFAFVSSDHGFSGNEAQSRNLVMVDIAQEQVHQLTTTGYLDTNFLVWSPDSRQIAFAYAEIYASLAQPFNPTTSLVTIATNEQSVLLDQPVRSLIWMPDGRIVFDGECGQERTFRSRTLCSLEQPGTEPTLYYLLGDSELIGISPDNQWLVLETSNGTTSFFNVVAQEIQDLEVQVSSCREAVWSPDSRYIVCGAVPSYVYEIGSGLPAQPLIDDPVLAWIEE